MKRTFFKDIIEYNKNQIIFYDENFTLNLASLLFSNYATNIDSTKSHATVKKKFNLFNVIKTDNLVGRYFDGKNHIVFVQPDFEKLITFFGYNLPKRESEINSIADRTESLYNTECQNALYDIESFIEIRNLPKKLIREISPYEEDQVFYRVDYQNKEYAGVIKNEELRFASAETDIKFDGIVQAQTMLAIQKKTEEFSYKDVN